MALTITVTKKQVTQTMPGCFNITLNLVCADGATEVINHDFSAVYKSNSNLTRTKANFVDQMQQAINAYKAAKVIYDSTTLSSSVTEVQNALVG